MAIADDFSVSTGGDIRYTGGGTNYTVLELHRFLQDLADDASASGDDLLDITYDTPSERSTDNIITLLPPYNIDDATAEKLYDGSISQDSGNTLYSGLVVVGSLASSTTLKIIQNNTFYDPLNDGKVSPFWGTGINTDPANNILLRCMVKTRIGGADIDGKRIRVQARKLGDTYSEFSATLGVGNSTAAIFTNTDLNNQTVEGTISGWTITNTEGFQQLDVNNNGSDEDYYSQWDRGAQTINDLYEYAKYIQRDNSGETIHGIDGELFRGITHEIDYNNEASGPFQEDEILTFGNGATAILLGLDDQGATGKMFVQLLTGVTPLDGNSITGGTSSATADINGAPIARTISPVFIGNSTGSSIIGGYGIGIKVDTLTASDQLFDLTNTLIVPPNFVTFTVGGLIIGEDRVLVGPENGGSLQQDQFTINTALTSASETSIIMNSSIPLDTPSTGTIRVQTDSGIYRRIEYTSYTGSTFTIASTDFSSDNVSVSNNAFISYIDVLASSTTETFQSVYQSDRPLFIRVRDGGGTPIKTFETPGTLGSAGGSTTAIRTTDA
jgi:hypothetical protein